MAKSLIITEKPSVAQEFARILGVSGRNDGYIENDKYVNTKDGGWKIYRFCRKNINTM